MRSGITITKSLTITGPGATMMAVSSGNFGTVFSDGAASGSTVTILGLTVENGYQMNGAGIQNRNSGSTLNLANVTVSNNTTCGVTDALDCGGGGAGSTTSAPCL